jgi:biotin carboxylase
MSPRHVVMIGFGKMLLTQLDGQLSAGSVVVVEDPDIVEKRSVEQDLSRLSCVAGLVTARYHQSLDFISAVESHLGGNRADAVLAGLEYGVFGAGALAARWGLPGSTTAAAACLTDKLSLRAAAAAGGLRNPEWVEVSGPGDVSRFARGGPVILKPANRHASLGVQRLEPTDDIDEAWAATVDGRDDALLPNRPLSWRYLAERVLDGHEYSTEALVRRGRIVFLNVTDKLTAAGRHPVELGHVVPAELTAHTNDQFAQSMARLIRAIGFSDGILHAEWMLDAQGPVLIECAGRVPGDSIVDLIDAAYGWDLIYALVNVLSGQVPRVPRPARRATAIRFLTAQPGVVSRVAGIDRSQSIRGVMRATISVTAGDDVRQLRSSWDRIGEVVAVGSSPAEARSRVDQAAAEVIVVTSSDLPIAAGGQNG